jgi:hypothetical protein
VLGLLLLIRSLSLCLFDHRLESVFKLQTTKLAIGITSLIRQVFAAVFSAGTLGSASE